MDRITQGSSFAGPGVHVKGRVCLLTSNFPRWAGDSTTPFILHLAQDMAREGWEVDVLAPHAPGAARREAIGPVNVHRFRYIRPERFQTLCYQGGALINLRRNPFAWLQAPVMVLAEMVALLRLSRDRKYDLLHAHWILPQGYVAVVVGRLIRTPTVVTVHGGDIFALRGGLLSAFKRFALDRAAAVTANSTETSRRVREICDRELHRVPIGATEPCPPSKASVDAIRARYARPGALSLIFVGRLVEEKGLGDLLAAIRLLKDANVQAVLLVLGEGQDRARFEKMSRELGLSGAVHFLGWVAPETVPEYLASADVFAAPSKTGIDGWTEGQGLSIVEALLAGTPVIATRSGGIPDIVQDGVTGILVDEAAPDAIAAAARSLATDPALRRRLAEAGCAHARAHFTRARSAATFDALYTSVVRGALAEAGVGSDAGR